MNAKTWSAVASVGERPSLSSRMRFGSPTARRPSVVGPIRARSRNASTCDMKSSLIVSMRGDAQGMRKAGSSRRMGPTFLVDGVGPK